MPIIDNFRYRPEIDGLRAVAVVAVVLFHAGFSCTGGYIGVDVFFVISGFLITSLIWKDLEAGRFSVANFWERRVRRIVPALVVVTVVTLIAGWFLLWPAKLEALGQASAAQAVFAANFHYWLDSGYFSGTADEKPLLHTWSLAVEEQFYFIVPFVLWGMFRIKAMRKRGAVVCILLVGFAASLGVSIYGVKFHPDAAFYLLPSRSWELLLGALVAFLPASPTLSVRRKSRELLTLAGLALILFSAFFYMPETPFPGAAALSPCFGTALIIWASGHGGTIVGSLLSARPFVFVGLISYSLYLWNWPFLAFSRSLSLGPLSIGHRCALVAAGLVFAVLSWKYVETPFRTRQLRASRKSVFAFAGTGLAVILVCGLVCISMDGFPTRFLVQPFGNPASDMTFVDEHTIGDIQSGKLRPIGAERSSTERPRVLVWGDSHAMAALPAIDTYLKERGIAGRAVTHSATAPVLGWYATLPYGLGADSIAYNQAVLAYIRSQKISDVIMSARWSVYRTPGEVGEGTFSASLVSTVRELAAVGCQPWILLDVPNHSMNVPAALADPDIADGEIASFCAKPTALNELEADDPAIMAKIKAAGGRLLSPKSRFLDPSGEYYIIQSNGIALFRDDHHLTPEGANLMLLPLLRESLQF